MQQHADNKSVDAGFDALDYGYANPPAMPGSHLLRAERRLWCAVIMQAFADIGAFDETEKTIECRDFRSAVRWLLRDGYDFAYICELAGVNPEIIRRAAQVFYGKTQLAMGAIYTT